MTEMQTEDIRISYYSKSGSGRQGHDAVHLPTGIMVRGKEIGDDSHEGVLVELERRVAVRLL